MTKLFGFWPLIIILFAVAEPLTSSDATADTTGVGYCYIEPECQGTSIGIMPYVTCKSAGGGGSSWLNEDGSGCYN